MANRMMVGGIAEGLDVRSEMRMEVDFAQMQKGGRNEPEMVQRLSTLRSQRNV